MNEWAVRVGKVSNIDYENGMLSVVYADRDGEVSRAAPMLDCGEEYYMPQVGDEVAVAHLSGPVGRCVVLGRVWNKGNKPPEPRRAGIYRKDFSRATEGEAYERLDDLLKKYTFYLEKLDLEATVKQGNAQAAVEQGDLSVTAKDGEICLEDATFKTTFSSIMARLEALDKDKTPRK